LYAAKINVLSIPGWGTAEAAASYIPSHLEPATAQKLLLTAVKRGHGELCEAMLALPHVQQHFDAATCEAAIEVCMIQERLDISFLSCIDKEPAAALLDADAVARLLLSAMKFSRFGVWQSAPEQLTAYTAASKHAELLLAELPLWLQHRRFAHTYRRDCGWDRIFQRGSHLEACLQCLLQLPGVAGISSSAVFGLQLEALQLSGPGPDASMPALCQLPAAVFVSSQELTQLIQAAPRGQQHEARKALLRLPAARPLYHAEIAQQLLVAAQVGDSNGLQRLFLDQSSYSWWGDARQLGSADVLPALAAAVKLDTKCLEELLKLPAAKQLSSEELTPLLQAAVVCGSINRLNALCKLPAAQQLSSAALEHLLLAALQQRRRAVVQRLSKLRRLTMQQ
jgi:hypothetical protein